MYESDYEQGLMSEVDAALTKALTAIGLLWIHGDSEGYRDDAIDALRELGMLMEEGAVPFIGCARLATDIVDNYAEDILPTISDDYFERRRSFAQMFDEDMMPSIEAPMLGLVNDEDED